MFTASRRREREALAQRAPSPAGPIPAHAGDPRAPPPGGQPQHGGVGRPVWPPGAAGYPVPHPSLPGRTEHGRCPAGAVQEAGANTRWCGGGGGAAGERFRYFGIFHPSESSPLGPDLREALEDRRTARQITAAPSKPPPCRRVGLEPNSTSAPFAKEVKCSTKQQRQLLHGHFSFLPHTLLRMIFVLIKNL